MNGLKRADRLAERLALFRVVDSAVDGSLSNAERLCGDADATGVQCGHGDLEAFALFAQQTRFVNGALVKDQIARGRGLNAQFVLLLAETQTSCGLWYYESAYSLEKKT